MSSKFVITSILLFFGFCSFTAAQTYKGPALGNISSGVTVTTDNFSRAIAVSPPKEKGPENDVEYLREPIYVDFAQAPIKSKYFEDPSVSGKPAGTAATILLKDFKGVSQTNFIPPDPHLAVGPDHIITTVNSSFAIFDKEGNMLKLIDGDQWYNSLIPSAGVFDPKIIYDHFDNHWIMVWLSVNDNDKAAYLLVSVSDDADPLGVWHNWALPANYNGSDSVSNWSDYEGVGYDKNALYITANQWSFAGSFEYAKLRIIPKHQLYLDNPNQIEWVDFWDFRYPSSTSTKIFNIRPAIMLDDAAQYYMLHSPGGSANFMVLYKVNDALGNPSISETNVMVSSYKSSTNAKQLGGGSMDVEAGGSALRSEPIYQDGLLHTVHSVLSPGLDSTSSLQYVKIDVNGNSAVEDLQFGAKSYWHYYPALAVDKSGNVVITYSRSSQNEYIGAYFTTKINSGSFEGSHLLRAGNGNYVKDYDSGRNRWGDYMGIAVDPADPDNIWMFTEYASNTNTWGTWIGEVRMVPFPGIKVETDTVDFSYSQTNVSSDTLTAYITNYGTDNLEITNISKDAGPFHVVDNFSFPISLASYDSLKIKVVFIPTDATEYNEVLNVTNNSGSFNGIPLKGHGYQIETAAKGILYASTGTKNNGDIITLNLTDGTGSRIGASRFDDVKCITVDPKTKIIYGVVTSLDSSTIIRVNAKGGDSYKLFDLDLPNMAAIAFDTAGVFYAAQKNGEIYQINLSNGSYNKLATTPINISGMAFNPLTNNLWVSVIYAGTKDKIFKVDVNTGDTTLVGSTKLNAITNDLVFDAEGNLFGVTGSVSQINSLISIDKNTGEGTIIGETGFKNIRGLALLTNGNATGVAENLKSHLPKDFTLAQNYPNPFNPTTKIEFGIPISSNVKVVIYNMLGEVVKTLVNGSMQAGFHSMVWNADDSNGSKVSSGIYFYELRASGANGNEFRMMRKMVLLK